MTVSLIVFSEWASGADLPWCKAEVIDRSPNTLRRGCLGVKTGFAFVLKGLSVLEGGRVWERG